MAARRDSQEPVALLTPEEREQELKPEPADLEAEAGRVDAPKDKNLDHEYSIPSTVKFAWLGTYFFFSLLLTLYNKLVLGMVSAFFPWETWQLRGTAAAWQGWKHVCNARHPAQSPSSSWRRTGSVAGVFLRWRY
jgi:hypothetical protein